MSGTLGPHQAHIGTVLFATIAVVVAITLLVVGVKLLLTGRDTDTPGARRKELRAFWALSAPFVVVAVLSVYMVFDGE